MAKTVVDVGVEPVVSAVTRVLTPPLRDLYALLARIGVVEIID
ncbi:Rv1535 domain-containing protein [Rhodococcus sp. NPDC003318]